MFFFCLLNSESTKKSQRCEAEKKNKKDKNSLCIKMYFKNLITQLINVRYEYASGGKMGLLSKIIH